MYVIRDKCKTVFEIDAKGFKLILRDKNLSFVIY